MGNRSIVTEWRKIGPAEAEALLAHNEVNRRLRPRLVEAYAEDMRRDLWDGNNGEAIKISRTGRLKDGQHRLNAIIVSGVTLELLVIDGVTDDAQKTMDQGSSRTATDVLRMEGIQNASWTTSVARWCLLGGEPGPDLETKLKHKASSAQIVRIVEDQPDITVASGRYPSMKLHIPGGPTALCYSWLWMHRTDPGDCEQFYGAMIEMAFKALNDPRKSCLRALTRMEREEGITSSSKDKAVATVSILTRSWNLWRKGEEASSIAIKHKSGRIIPPEKPI